MLNCSGLHFEGEKVICVFPESFCFFFFVSASHIISENMRTVEGKVSHEDWLPQSCVQGEMTDLFPLDSSFLCFKTEVPCALK